MSATPDAESAVQAAGKAGLRYVSDSKPGIRRKAARGGFRYVAADGKPVRDPEILGRIRSLVIPPAWTDVWICPYDSGHIQATGRDAKGRKQYRYHPRWRSTRDETKYAHVIGFGKALPGIRRRVDQDLARPGLPREKVLATVVRLLETTLMRVGNEEYARSNGSFGLTTLRDRHVRIDGTRLQFRFKGKSSKEHFIELNDRRVAAVVRRCRELPGYELFQYLDEDGERRSIDSDDVNGYLREITGEDYTAKDFRTWAGTLLAALALREFETFDSAAQAKKNLVRAIESVALRLGNTPAICRKCYIHPAVMDAFLDGTIRDILKGRAEKGLEDLHNLDPEEAAVLALLQQRLQRPEMKQRPRRRAVSRPKVNGAQRARAAAA
ncbi:MAG TPA: DNA topoisomerase IB [Burkholderiales bacterium]